MVLEHALARGSAVRNLDHELFDGQGGRDSLQMLCESRRRLLLTVRWRRRAGENPAGPPSTFCP